MMGKSKNGNIAQLKGKSAGSATASPAKQCKTGSIFLYLAAIAFGVMLYLMHVLFLIPASVLVHVWILLWLPVIISAHFCAKGISIGLIALTVSFGILILLHGSLVSLETIFVFIVTTIVMTMLTIYVSRTQSIVTELKESVRDAVKSDELKNEYQKELIDALLKTIDAKDSYTYKHSKRVGYYAKLLAQSCGVAENEAEYISIAAVLHDVGKIGMPESILNKEERLTQEEYLQVKEHPVIGARIAGNLIDLEPVAPIIFYHHERYDGTGYPERRRGDDIPIGARIISIVDSFDAMTSDRDYRRGMPVEEALGRLLENMGSQYDPQLCVSFVDLIRNQGMIHPEISNKR